MGSRVDHSLSLLLFWDWPRFDFAGIVVQMGTPEGCVGSGEIGILFLLISKTGLRWFVVAKYHQLFFHGISTDPLQTSCLKDYAWTTLKNFYLVDRLGVWQFLFNLSGHSKFIGLWDCWESLREIILCYAEFYGLWLLKLRGKPNKLNDGAWREVETLYDDVRCGS